MPRPLSGRIRVRRLRDGTEVFDVRIRDQQHTVGRTPRWTHDPRVREWVTRAEMDE